jgi:lipoate-protein ligase A
VKLDQEEGESPGNERESGAHRSGLALVRWQTGGGVVASDEG